MRFNRQGKHLRRVSPCPVSIHTHARPLSCRGHLVCTQSMDPLTFARTYGFEATLRCQDRLIRRDQALAVGVTEPTLAGLLRRGRWKRVLPRVFAVGVDHMHPMVRVRSAWLWAGDDSVISGAAA